MHVVPAGVHHWHFRAVTALPVAGARVRQAGLLKHREPVHVGPQQYGRALPVGEHADDAGAAYRGGDLVAEAS